MSQAKSTSAKSPKNGPSNASKKIKSVKPAAKATTAADPSQRAAKPAGAATGPVRHKSIKRRLLRTTDILVIVAVVGLCSFGIYNRLNAASQLPPCTTQGKQYELSLQNDSFDKSSLNLMRCDTILFMNNDTQPYMLAVGVHDKHIEYPGFKSAIVRPGEGIMFDALESGTFQIHDHLRDNAKTELVIRLPRE